MTSYPPAVSDTVSPWVDPSQQGYTAISSSAVAPEWFDAQFYLSQNSDIEITERSAYNHFREKGWREFRNPAANFDLWWYYIWHLDADLRLNPAEHYASQGQALGLRTSLGEGRLEVSRQTEFNARSLALFKRIEAPAEVFARIASNLARMSIWDVADMIAVRACALAPDDPQILVLLARIVAMRGGWRRAVEPLRRATTLDDQHPDWFHDLGYACERLGWLDDAVVAYRKALAGKPSNEDTLYRLGYIHERQGASQEAADCYARLAALNSRVDALGVGVFHEQENDWSAAEAAYASRANQACHSAPAALHFAHGFAFEMLLRWEEAAMAYQRALAQEPSHAQWHYRHALMLERLECNDSAAAAYACATQLQENADWLYRQGLVLFRIGDFESALGAWLRSVPGQPARLESDQDATALEARRLALRIELTACQLDAEAHYQLGLVCEQLGRLEEAAGEYRATVLRRENHQPSDHFRLGAVLYRLGRLDQACLAMAENRLYKRDFSHLPQSDLQDIKIPYAEFLDTLDVDDGIILYESFHGASVSCNPLAVFRRAYQRFAGSGRLHVWAIKPHAVVPTEYSALPDVIFVRHGSPLYVRYLASAGWLVNNNTFMPYFVRRPEQRYLNLWHGTPLKKLGADIPGALFDHKNCTRNLLQATHLAMPNRHTWQSLLESNHVRDVFDARLAETGHARIDMMLNACPATRTRLRERVGVSGGEPIVLYAPTWRGCLGGASLDAELVTAAMEQLDRPGVALLFSAHHLVARKLGPLPIGARAVPSDVDITELLSIVDVLVTDYSSILFDYLPSHRPLILHAPDAEQYSTERGLYKDLTSIPAYISRSTQELHAALDAVLAGEAPSIDMSEALSSYCARDDGAVSERVLDFFFSDAPIEGEVFLPKTDKRHLLIQAGNFNPNGVTASFNRLASQLDPEKFSIAVVVDPWSMESYPQRMQRYAELPKHVHRWGRVSHPVLSVEDQWLHQRLGMADASAPRAQRQLDRILKREYRRQFGNARIDTAIDFGGYTAFWSALFARGRPPGVRALTYLHNEMRQEAATRHPQLARVFNQYRYCDALVSVSPSLHEVNRRTLTDCVDHDLTRFCFAENAIDPDFIRTKAKESLPDWIQEWRRGHVLIGSAGRLSPEKGQARLLDAFAAVHRHFPKTRLAIAGEGAEKPALMAQIKQLCLSDSVRLLGAVENPYPLMRELDLFVLPSFYEGQAIVLLEALTLGIPVLSTDIPGPRSVLAGDQARLVENSTQGLVDGMRSWLSAPTDGRVWDAEGYAREALAQFERITAPPSAH